jgi:hypothetical protein
VEIKSSRMDFCDNVKKFQSCACKFRVCCYVRLDCTKREILSVNELLFARISFQFQPHTSSFEFTLNTK